MSESNDTQNPQRRRMSLVDMFSGRSNISTSPPSGAVQPTPESAQHRRGASISAMGLTTSGGGQPSPYNAFAKQRRASISTSSASSSPEFRNSFGDEPAVIEEDDGPMPTQGSPSSPSFARRLSFGAQALRDVRQGGAVAPSGGRRPSSSLYTLSEDNNRSAQAQSRSPETAKTGGKSQAGLCNQFLASLFTIIVLREGFNWSEALRDKTKRSPSFSTGNPFGSGFNRPKPVTAAPVIEPPKELPKATSPPVRMKKPDHLGERMLRGDFMMD